MNCLDFPKVSCYELSIKFSLKNLLYSPDFYNDSKLRKKELAYKLEKRLTKLKMYYSLSIFFPPDFGANSYRAGHYPRYILNFRKFGANLNSLRSLEIITPSSTPTPSKRLNIFFKNFLKFLLKRKFIQKVHVHFNT